MVKQNLCFIFVLMAALTGCSQSEYSDLPQEKGKSGEVRMESVTGILEGITRAPIQGSASPTLKARVLLSGTSGAYTEETDTKNLFYDGTMTFAGSGAVGFDGEKQNYPSNGSEVYLCGLFPVTEWAAVTETSTAAYTFDGKTDVMAAPEQATSKSDGQGTPAYKTLVFKHLLTNLIIKAGVDGSAGALAADKIQALWGNITSISLTQAGGAAPNNKVTVTLKGGTAPTATAFAGATAVGFHKASGSTYPYTFADEAFASMAIPASPTVVAYSLIAPVIAKGGENEDFKLLVKTANQPTGAVVPLSLSVAGDTQGKYCEVTLTFKATGINAKATIDDWTAGGTASGSLQ